MFRVILYVVEEKLPHESYKSQTIRYQCCTIRLVNRNRPSIYTKFIHTYIRSDRFLTGYDLPVDRGGGDNRSCLLIQRVLRKGTHQDPVSEDTQNLPPLLHLR